jgi:hypothetical protein
VLLMGAKSNRSQAFDEIKVDRIDVIEPDGTLRIAVSDHDRMPAVMVKGKESPKVDRPQAGMLFTTMREQKMAAWSCAGVAT